VVATESQQTEHKKNAGEQFVAVPLLLSINGGAVVDGEGILVELGVE
jgi:hypothetical protein